MKYAVLILASIAFTVLGTWGLILYINYLNAHP
jgi:hypothetical protein